MYGLTSSLTVMCDAGLCMTTYLVIRERRTVVLHKFVKIIAGLVHDRELNKFVVETYKLVR